MEIRVCLRQCVVEQLSAIRASAMVPSQKRREHLPGDRLHPRVLIFDSSNSALRTHLPRHGESYPLLSDDRR